MPPPPDLRLPLIVSESLRSALMPPAPRPLSSASCHEEEGGVVSILLSSADLAKLDLSELQLFSIDGTLHMLSSSPANYASASSGLIIDPGSLLAADNAAAAETADDLCFHRHNTPLVLSPAVVDRLQHLSDEVSLPILKSKAVMEAEKACAAEQQEMVKQQGAISRSPMRARKKALSMVEMVLEEETRVDDKATVAVEEQKEELEEKARTLRQKRKEKIMNRRGRGDEEEAARIDIDLRASPAAKFLVQVMPWELTPPITPITPAAVPFLWEVAPGKPKPKPSPYTPPYHTTTTTASLPLPPRLLLPHSSVAGTTIAALPPTSSILPAFASDSLAIASPPSAATHSVDDSPAISRSHLHSSAREVPPHKSHRHGRTQSWQVFHNLRLYLHAHRTDSAPLPGTTSPEHKAAEASDEHAQNLNIHCSDALSLTNAHPSPPKQLRGASSLVRLLSKVKQKSRAMSWKSAYSQLFRRSDDQIGPLP